MSKLSQQDLVVELYVAQQRESMFPVPVRLVESFRFHDVQTRSINTGTSIDTTIDLPLESYNMVLQKSQEYAASAPTHIVVFDILVGGIFGCAKTVPLPMPVLYTHGFAAFVLANEQFKKAYGVDEFAKTCMAFDLALALNAEVSKFREKHGWAVVPVIKER